MDLANERVAWFNGKIVRESEVLIPFRDQGFLRGDAVFDMTRSFAGKAFRLQDHVARLYRSLIAAVNENHPFAFEGDGRHFRKRFLRGGDQGRHFCSGLARLLRPAGGLAEVDVGDRAVPVQLRR